MGGEKRLVTRAASRWSRRPWMRAAGVVVLALAMTLAVSAPTLFGGGPLQAQERTQTLPTALPEREETAADPDIEETVRQPFGASMFVTRRTAGGEGPSPEYRVSRGDEVAVFIWGAVTVNTIAEVDPAGNIFIEGIGPVAVAGVRSADLNEHITRFVRTRYTENVEVYATLVDSRTIGVFVTGFVDNPGRYPGAPSESVIDFIAKAGGIDPNRGSFRDISVLRGGRSLAAIDLYRFLLDGQLPQIQFREGDTILVRAQHPVVTVDGDIRNDYQFEFGRNDRMQGQELLRLARPLPGATHALVSGTRNNRPYSAYLTLDDLSRLSLRDQDRIIFDADARQELITIKLVGSFEDESIRVAEPDTRLGQLLDYVAVDPAFADIDAVHLRRRRVARQQKVALDDALDRLERTVLTSTAPTDGATRILEAEAQLIQTYVERARTIQPQGIVVLARADGTIADIRLEDGDEIVIPLRSQVVTIAGEVIAPQTVVYEEGLRLRDYIERAGGYGRRSDQSYVVIRQPNGHVAVHQTAENPPVTAGDEVIVPPRVGGKGWQIVKDLSEVLFRAVFAGAVVAGIND